MPQSCILKNGWKGKFVYFNILFFLERKEPLMKKKDNSMDEPQKVYVRWKKPDTKG